MSARDSGEAIAPLEVHIGFLRTRHGTEPVNGETEMPREVFDVEEFVKLSETALACRVKRLKDLVKLKLRTPRTLYTIRLEAPEAEEVLKRVKCEVQEV